MSLQNAIRAFNSGDFRKAHSFCQQVLTAQPTNPIAMNLMGAICGNGGRHDLAAEWMGRAVKAAPKDIGYRVNYVNALLQLDRPDEALSTLEGGLAIVPDNHELQTLKGILIGRSGDLDSAADLFLGVIRVSPDYANAYFNLSVIRQKQGASEESLSLLRKTLELDPKNAQAANNLAGLLLDRAEFVEALRCLQKFLQLQPKSAQAYFNLSVALDAAGDADQSLVALRNALTLEPNLRRGQFKLVNQLIASGKFDEASSLIQEWQDKDPNDSRLLALQSRFLERQGDMKAARAAFDRIKMEDRVLPAVRMSEATLLGIEGDAVKAAEILESVLEERGADAAESLGIRFQLGDLYDKAKEYDKAFENYRAGNSLRRNALSLPFDRDRNAESFEKIASAYVAGWQAKSDGDGHPSETPIFIIGMPRSGTSLTEQMLGCHSQIYPAGELKQFSNAIQSTHNGHDVKPGPGFTIVENDLVDDRSPVIPDDFGASTLGQIGQRYIDAISRLSGGQSRVTDKMPYNYLFAPLIKMALPNAKIIHTRRNPIDTCLSCYFQNFAGGSEFSFDLADAGAYYRNYTQVMKRYREEIGLDMLEIDYEETVSDTEAVVRRILEYCGLEFEEACLQAHKSRRPVVTASYQQVREPVYTRSVSRWRNYERHLGPLLDALGPLAEG